LGCLYLTFDDVFPFLVGRINARCTWCRQALAGSANRDEFTKRQQNFRQLLLFAFKTNKKPESKVLKNACFEVEASLRKARKYNTCDLQSVMMSLALA